MNEMMVQSACGFAFGLCNTADDPCDQRVEVIQTHN